MNTWPLDKDEAAALSELNEAGIESALIYLTDTGMKKSILDATLPLRQLLTTAAIHNYDNQLKGPKNKVVLPAIFYKSGNAQDMDVSVYRPLTKNGDPRLWPYKLTKYAKAGDVLAVFVHDKKLHFTNLSAARVIEIYPFESDLTKLLSNKTFDYEEVAQELLEMLRQVARNGLIPAVGSGDTAIGRTIESALGISMNANQLPDYKGIELKSKRTLSHTRNGLFAQVPNWEVSNLKSFREIVDNYGYKSSADFRLYCTISSKKANSQGLILHVDENKKLLEELHRRNNCDTKVCVWLLNKLHDRLQSKHRETFWIGAEEVSRGSKKYFRLDNVRHTRRPSNIQFDRLLTQGDITVDHMIKMKNGRTHEKGPQFKVHRGALNELFLGSPRDYRL